MQLIRMMLVLVLCQTTAVVAAASEAARGSQNERFERFDTSPVSRPTYVADHLPAGRASSNLTELRAQLSRIDHQRAQRCLRITHRCQLATIGRSFDQCRAAHTALPQGLWQHLQGVALRRTRRADSVEVDRSLPRDAARALRTATLPSAAATARLETCAAALRRPGPRQRCLDVPVRERLGAATEPHATRRRRRGSAGALYGCLGGPPALRSRRAAYGEGRR